MKKKEILSSCCAFGSDGTEEVHVLKADCPLERQVGQRIVEPMSDYEEYRTECTCVYYSGIRGYVIEPCEYYKGTKKVQRNKQREYKVLCKALEEENNA